MRGISSKLEKKQVFKSDINFMAEISVDRKNVPKIRKWSKEASQKFFWYWEKNWAKKSKIFTPPPPKKVDFFWGGGGKI